MNERNEYIGQRIENQETYELVEPLGEGEFGLVFLARCESLRSPVVIKLLRNCRLAVADRERFRQEAEVLARLEQHNIVKVQHYGDHNDIPYIIMEYIPGSNLRKKHPEGQKVSLRRVVDYVKDVAAALQHAHDRDNPILHLDIKPENMLQHKDGHVVLSDFGLARVHKVFKESHDYRESLPGNREYMAPEHRDGSPCEASDQYSLAVVVYEWLCGERPFQGSLDNVCPLPLRKRDPAIPVEVEDVVMRALALHPEERYSSVQDFADALEKASLRELVALPDGELIGRRFGDFIIVQRLGGEGIVQIYEARYAQRSGKLAIIVLFHPYQPTEEERERFLSTVSRIRHLRHNGILEIKDHGLQDGILYIAYEYLLLSTLRELHPRAESGDLLRVVSSYVKQVAAALQEAHNQGVIHGDIRPENMFLRDGQVILSNFSPARAQSSPDLDSLWNGTYVYTAPEYIDGNPCAASDQYSLAIVVYEWLVGESPFQGDRVFLINQHKSSPPPSMRKKRPEVPPAVERVVMRALAKEPDARFRNVEDFAKALEEASSKSRKRRRKTRLHERRAVLATLATAGSLALAVGVGVGVFEWSRSVPPQRVTQARDLIAIYTKHKQEVDMVAWSPNGKYIASAGKNGLIRVWDTMGQDVAHYQHSSQVMGVSWSEDSRYIASSSLKDGLYIWEAETGKRFASLPSYGGAEVFLSLKWSPNQGNMDLALAGNNQVFIFSNLIQRKFEQREAFSMTNAGKVNAIAWYPSGDYIASANSDHTVGVWSLKEEKEILTYKGHQGSVYCVDCSPIGDFITSGGDDGYLRVWYASMQGIACTNATFRSYPTSTSAVRVVAWSPNGKFIASCGEDNVVQVWNFSGLVGTYTSHTSRVNMLSWSPDSSYIASCSNDQTVHIWPISSVEKVISDTENEE